MAYPNASPADFSFSLIFAQFPYEQLLIVLLPHSGNGRACIVLDIQSNVRYRLS